MEGIRTIGEIMEDVRRSMLIGSEDFLAKSKTYETIECRVIDKFMVFFRGGREIYWRGIEEFEDVTYANAILEHMRKKNWVDDSVMRWMLGIISRTYGYKTIYPCGYMGFCR